MLYNIYNQYLLIIDHSFHENLRFIMLLREKLKSPISWSNWFVSIIPYTSNVDSAFQVQAQIKILI